LRVIDTIGNTPLAKLKSGFFAKLEMFNPTGSIKDRTAYSLINGSLDKITNKGIVEPTAGNTGISLAFLGAYYNIPTTIVMPENMSVQRIRIMESFGAKVILTKAEGGMTLSIETAKEMEKDGFFMPNQFSNPLNPLIHRETTAVEITKQLDDIDIFVCCVGTGGTFSGIASYLKEINPKIKAIAVEPQGSPFLSRQKSGIHKIQGIGPGFLPDVMDMSLVDEIITVSDDDALSYQDRLLKYEAVFAGISSGAAYCASIKTKEKYPDKNIVTIFADSMDRYI
jgi:cysteine synthase A